MRTRLLAALLCGMFNPLGAQIVLNPPKDPGVISVNVELVNVLCSVRDRQGAYVKDLNQDDFEIREDGKRQAITHFAREVETPMTVALLLDVSGSVAGILGTEKSAGQRFFDEVLRTGRQGLTGRLCGSNCRLAGSDRLQAAATGCPGAGRPIRAAGAQSRNPGARRYPALRRGRPGGRAKAQTAARPPRP